MKKSDAKVYAGKSKITREQQLKQEGIRRLCDHKIEDHMKVRATKNTEDQVVKCQLCGSKFSIKPVDEKEFLKAREVLLDMLECVKLKGETKHDYYLTDKQKEQIAETMVMIDNAWDLYKVQYLDKLESNNYQSKGFNFNPNGSNFNTNGGFFMLNQGQEKNFIDQLIANKHNSKKNKNKKKHKNRY